jgi:hypothetical protein
MLAKNIMDTLTDIFDFTPSEEQMITLNRRMEEYESNLRSDISMDVAMQIEIYMESKVGSAGGGACCVGGVASSSGINSNASRELSEGELLAMSITTPTIEIGGMVNCADAEKYSF